MLMETHYKNPQVKVQVLMVMHNVSKENPQLIAKHVNTMIADKSTTQMEQHSGVKIYLVEKNIYL
jgi:hypothetical protein